MQDSFLIQIVKEFGVLSHLIAIFIAGSMGAIVSYLYKVTHKGDRFKFPVLISNIMVAILIVFLSDSILNIQDAKLNMGMMVVIGILANKIFELIESKAFLNFLIKKIK